jgi:hypothetical protein
VSFRSSGSAASLLVIYSLAFAGSLCAQVGPRIAGDPNNSPIVRIPGTTHPLVGTAKEIGRAPASLPMERMLLYLASSPEQEGRNSW